MRLLLTLALLLGARPSHAGSCAIYAAYMTPQETYSGLAGYVDGGRVYRGYDSYRDSFSDVAGHIDGGKVWRNYDSYKDIYSDFLACSDGDILWTRCDSERSPLGYFWNGRVWKTRAVGLSGSESYSDSRGAVKPLTGGCSPGEALAAALLLGLLN